MEPIILYGNGPSPNPIKVAIVLEELGLPFSVKKLDFKEIKDEPYISLNPNGRLPAIEDPNTGVNVFESGAILEYLVDTYDKEGKIHSSTLSEKWAEKSWLHFQMSGQGPYFGQRVWFMRYHPEKVPSAIERYGNEIKRVVNVVNAHLKKHGTPYLIGNKASYVDFAWIPWQASFHFMFGDGEWDWEAECPEFTAWQKRLMERPSVKKIYAREEFQMPPGK